MEETKMVNKEERMKVLEMVRDGVISAEEAAQLLETMSDSSDRPSPGQKKTGKVDLKGKFLRVRVTDATSNKAKVNVTVPLSFIELAVRTGARFVPDMNGIDVEELWEAIQDGATGKMVDVTDEEGGEHVEVYID